MIRTSVIPTKSSFKLTLDFPKDYLGEEVEIIAFKKSEGLAGEKEIDRKISFTVLHVENGFDYRFNREDANER